jgi:DNA mismatch endonuclease (patch repair protein)
LADIVDKATRSRMMAGIRGKNTKPELLLRSGLHRKGFRFRVHVEGLPGKPDIVFPKYRAVIFAHGCFWHGHDCPLFKWPSTRKDFWRMKITTNNKRDQSKRKELADSGWRILTVWECALKGNQKFSAEAVVGRCSSWLRSRNPSAEIRGKSWSRH